MGIQSEAFFPPSVTTRSGEMTPAASIHPGWCDKRASTRRERQEPIRLMTGRAQRERQRELDPGLPCEVLHYTGYLVWRRDRMTLRDNEGTGNQAEARRPASSRQSRHKRQCNGSSNVPHTCGRWCHRDNAVK